MSAFQLVTVQSGARSLRSLEHGETFHPVVGPMIEARSMHVAQQRIAERAAEVDGPFVIWDVGLGAAANAIAAMEAVQGATGRVELHSFDSTLEPLVFGLKHAEELGYVTPWRSAIETLIADHVAYVGGLEWRYHSGDFRELVSAPPAPAPHAILYDAYSPASNPGMWTLEHFTRLRRCLREDRPCTMSNYSRSTAVRVTLLLAGFLVGRGTATGEKDQTTLAATRRDLLADPLDEAWLGRLSRSTQGGPLREGSNGGPISEADLRAVREIVRLNTVESTS